MHKINELLPETYCVVLENRLHEMHAIFLVLLTSGDLHL